MAQARKPKNRSKKDRTKDAADVRQDPAADVAQDIALRRRRARWRSLLVPGAGLWELGLIGPGWVCYGLAIATLVCCAGLALFVCTVTFWAAAVSLLAYLAAGTVEYAAVGRAVPRDRQPPPRQFRMALMTLLVGFAAVLLAVIRYDGRMIMQGATMAPQVREGDWLLFSKFLPTWGLKRGTMVAFAVEQARAREAGLARVIGLPGDRIAREGGRFVINGRMSPFQAQQFMTQEPQFTVPYHPESIEVPPGKYYVVMDDVVGGTDSQVLGWIAAEQIISSRMLLFSRRAWAKSVNQPWEP